MAQPTRIAYLGPPGTYGHQAAKQFSKRIETEGSAELVPCSTIPEIYTDPSEYLVMPIQNIIHGVVTETLDSLLSPLAGPSNPKRYSIASGEATYPRIISDLDLPIRHSLVARRGTRMEDIQWVRSHEQALGQSSAFLSERLPHAKLYHWPSTAGAAMSLFSDPDGLDGESSGIGVGAAICSASAIADQPELEILYEGTQAINGLACSSFYLQLASHITAPRVDLPSEIRTHHTDNYTRFLLLTRNHPQPQLLPSIPPIPTPRTPQSHFYALSQASQISLLPTGSVRAIHSRPDPSRTAQTRYPYVLLVETSQYQEATLGGDGEGQGEGEGRGILYLGAAESIGNE